jgi:hypothetical protein
MTCVQGIVDHYKINKKSAFSPALGAGTSVCENQRPKLKVSGS